MDVESSVSRDPRLSNRSSRPSLPAKLSQHEVQQRPPTGPRQQSEPDAQNDASGDQFIRGISDLVQTAVFTATNKSEKERIQKKRSNTEDLLRKAKAHSGFPSTVEFFQNARSDEDKVLSSIDEKIKNHETRYQRLVEDLRTKWVASTAPRPSKTEEKVPQLQQDLRSANDKILDLHEDIARLRGRDTSVDSELKTLIEMLGIQQKSFGSYTNSLSLLKKDMDEQSTRLKQLDESTKRPVERITPDTKKALDNISAQYKDLEQKTTKWGEKIDLLSSSYQRISELPDQIHQSLKDQQQKLGQLENSQSTSSNLDNAVQSLNRQFESLQEIQQAKDDMMLAEMEDLKENLRKTGESQGRLAETVKETLLRAPREPLDPKVDALFNEVQRWHTLLEPINMALHSLESRYNNISTEPIVQHMVGAMHEMYPSVDHVWRELQVHKRSLDQELPLLQKKIEQLENQEKPSVLPHDELNSIKAQQKKLSHSISTLLERYQWFSQEEFRGMQTRLESLAEKQNSTDGVFQQKQTADQEFLQEIQREHESLNSRLASLHDAFDNLNSEYTQAKPNAATDDDMRSLELRITALEKSTIQSYDKLKGQFDRFQKTVQLPDAPSESGSLQRESTPKNLIRLPPRPDLLDGRLGMKIKRRHHSPCSDDERSPAPSDSPCSPGSTVSQTFPAGEIRKKKKEKKRKRRRLGSDAQAPMNIDE
ncbi:hypothetical protein BDW62DRAFT_120423 [Aspergillus aurantiobrunneus]